MHFVDDIDFVFAGGRRVLGVFQDFADVVDACVGGGIDFQQIDVASGINLRTAFAYAARFAVLRVFAVEAFGKDAGDGGFAHAARSGQQVGVMQPAFVQGILQGFDDVFLTD
ncbi:hypothetical protein NEILACOT_04195 [Neisseria lactamica ATCC 23970]|uniref:Uncharacterized protein n=1 Tax=Neisseria lactamica ATCC 23970 TaxID=546265 RepID=D0W9I3_NEILA|nr:hypothetical protein NEILACOT_04195 [Neisseria lactamica ATCC 23970]